MTNTTQGGKQTIDPPTPSCMKYEVRRDDEVVEVSGELVDQLKNEAEIPREVTPVPRPQPLFPQKLGTNTENGKY